MAGGGGSSNNGGASLDLSEIRLGEATLVPVQSNGGELSHGLECRTADGEILQLQLTRFVITVKYSNSSNNDSFWYAKILHFIYTFTFMNLRLKKSPNST